MKKITLIGFLLIISTSTFSQNADSLSVEILNGEYWWAGLSSEGHNTPYDAQSTATHDLWGYNGGNQAQPILLSTKGRLIWSENPIKYSFNNGTITISSRDGKIDFVETGNNLPAAYYYAVENYFPPNGKIPAKKLFTHPQYNTWIELMYDQNEKDILEYAQNIIDNGYPPGVLMIDDNWQYDYGVWDFSPRKFKDPKGMITKLHAMGFQIMLWVCPFVSADSEEFRYLAKEGMLLLDPQEKQEILWANTMNKAAIVRWWNGASALLDLSNPKSQEWFKSQLNYLVDEYGVDGFKFDAGDANFYTNGVVSYKTVTPNDHTAFFAEIGLDYPLNEYRASWKMAGLPLAQRLRDKEHKWADLQKLIPDVMSQSMMGYTYTCPDMIGGGEYQSFLKTETIDEELVVRSAQVHALMPMMQFSVAPWRVLSEENAKICLEAAKLHTQMGDLFLKLAREAAKTGDPIVKPMAFVYPDGGYETVKDQFMLGDSILVAPVVKKGGYKRNVILPKGRWKGDDGKIVKGGSIIEIDVPLERIPYYTKID
ncbi:glycoside hydrolase family 31 protein [Pareuzebyella sediminis]|uniref:glycoside hydrolase family 31 protein n=1 Tax=Pareuzebyella sediminis TaxID=2607998 RepID=UPI0011EBB31E|nr:glycoside hydrolase family 31 protein [Pareuzebyella sediminis]